MSGNALDAVLDPELETKVRRLIANDSVEDIVEYDVSDAKLYGRRNRRVLSGELAKSAEAAGCVAEVYESVYWWTFGGVPVKPYGVYLLMPRQVCDDPDGDADQYRAIRLSDDWGWYARHFVIGMIMFGLFISVCVASLAMAFERNRRGDG